MDNEMDINKLLYKDEGQTFNEIPDDFHIGGAKGEGDCFFDSIAQTLLQIRPSRSNISVKTLRQLCQKFAQNSLETSESSWFIEHWKTEPLHSIQQYITRIELTAWDIELSAPPLNIEKVICGQAKVEGRIICEEYDVKLHIIEIQVLYGKEIWSHRWVDKNGNHASNNCGYDDKDMIHLIVKENQQFMPVLRRGKSSINSKEEVKSKQEEICNAIHTNNIERMRELLPLTLQWSLDKLTITSCGTMDNFIQLICETKVFGPLSSEMNYFIEEVFVFQRLLACMANLSKEFNNKTELLNIIRSSLETLEAYSEHFIRLEGLTTHHVCLAFLLTVAKQYENLKKMHQSAGNFNWCVFKETELYLTKLLSPLIEYTKVLAMDNDIQKIKMSLLNNSEQPALFFLQIQHLETKIREIKSMFRNYSFGTTQTYLVKVLRSLFTEARFEENNQISKIGNLEKSSKLYSIMKDIYSLERILSYIDQAMFIDMNNSVDEHVHQLVIERALQVTGEYLKDTVDTPSLSQISHQQLESKGVQVKQLGKLRDMLSHSSLILTYPENIFEKMDVNRLSNVQSDLKKIKKVIRKVLLKLHFMQIKELLGKISIDDACTKTDEKSIVTKLGDLLRAIQTSESHRELSEFFKNLCLTLDKHTHKASLEKLNTSIREIVFIVKLKEIGEDVLAIREVILKMHNQTISATVPKFQDEKRRVFEAFADTKTTISTISNTDAIEEYEASKTRVDDCESIYGLSLSDIFTKEVMDKIYENTHFRKMIKELKFGFDSDLQKSINYRLQLPLTNLQLNILKILSHKNLAEENLNHVLREFLNQTYSHDELFKLLMVEKRHKKDFQSILHRFRSKFSRIIQAERVLSKILQQVVIAAEEVLSTERIAELNHYLKKKEALHVAIQKLLVLSSGIKAVPKQKFVSIVQNIDDDALRKQLHRNYSSRLSCKTVLTRTTDPYGSLLKAMSKSYNDAIQSFEKFTNTLSMELRLVANENFEIQLKRHFEKNFYSSSILMEKLRNNATLIHNPTMAALEMLMLKSMDLLKEMSTPKEFLKLEKLLQASIARKLNTKCNFKSLRNYLAHGDALSDMVETNVNQIIIVAANIFIENGRAIFTINHTMMNAKRSSFFKNVLETPYLTDILSHIPEEHQKKIQLITESNYWINEDWKSDLLNVLNTPKITEPSKSIEHIDHLFFTKLVDQELIAAVSTGDAKSIKFFLHHIVQKQILKNNQETLLHVAAKNGDLDGISQLLERNFQINAADEINCTPLHIAVLNQKLEAINYLLINNADVNHKNNNGYTSLHFAAYNGNAEIILLLIKHGATVQELSNFQTTPLLIAARNGHTRATEALINKVELIDLPDEYSRTPLYHAAESGHETIAQLLIQKGVDINGAKECKMSPLQIATERGHLNIINLLLKHGANVDYRDSNSMTALHYVSDVKIAEFLINKGASINLVNHDFPLLHNAVVKKNVELVKLLLNRGAKTDITCNRGRLALFLASDIGDSTITKLLLEARKTTGYTERDMQMPLYTACLSGNLNIVTLLLDYGANVDTIFESNTSQDTEWPLQIAINNKHFHIADMLLEYGANVNVKDTNGLTALHHAALIGATSTVKKLLEKGADVNAGDIINRTPILYGIKSGSYDITELLIKYEANVNVVDKNNHTPAFLATWVGSYEIIQLLIKHKVNLDHVIDFLPLHSFAVQYGHLEIAELLLKQGINVNAKGFHSRTPLHVACRTANPSNDMSKMVKMLIHNKADVGAVDLVQNTPLHEAAKFANSDVIEVLLTFGADINAKNSNGKTPMNLANERGKAECLNLMKSWDSNISNARKPFNSLTNFEVNDEHNEKTSHILDDQLVELFKQSVLDDKSEIIKELLAEKSNSNLSTFNNYNLLHACVLKNNSEILKTALQVLKEQGLNIDHLSNEGLTPLHLATKIRGQEAVECLLKSGVNVNGLTLNQKQSALHLAIQNDDMDILKLLLNAQNITIDIKDFNGETPLHLACKSGNLNIVNLLISHKVQIDCSVSNQDAPIHVAIKNKHYPVVQALLANGANANAVGRESNRPLQYCMHYDNLYIAQMLTDHGAVVNCINNEGHTPLHEAVKAGNENAVKFLLHLGAQVNGTSGTDTPLHIAASKGYLKILETLISYAADVNAKNSTMQTPLHIAATNDHYGVVDFLLKKVDNIDNVDEDKCTPLWLATKDAHYGIIQLLLENGANVNAISKDNLSVLHLAVLTCDTAIVEEILAKNADVDFVGNDGKTPLHFAITNQACNITDMLLKRGANVNQSDDIGRSPLCLAIENRNDYIVKLLLDNKASVNISSSDSSQKSKPSPLLSAIYINDTNMVDLLIEKGADLNLRLDIGLSYMHHAVKLGSLQTLKTLCSHGLSVNVTADDDVTPLHVAITAGSLQCAHYLIEAGANVNAVVTATLETPLLLAVKMDQFETVTRLLSKGANINDKSTSQRTALHSAVTNGQIHMIRLLIENGALVDSNYCNLIHAAAISGNLEVMKLILETLSDETNVVGLLNIYEGGGHSPLMHAVMYGHLEVTELLLMLGANVNTLSENNLSALHFAAVKGFKSLVLMLIKYGADVNSNLHENVTTPLHAAAEHGDAYIIQILLDEGSMIDRCEQTGSTALMLAIHKGHQDAIKILLQNGANPFTKNASYSALLAAALDGNTEIISLISEKLTEDEDGVKILNVQDKYGLSPLMAATLEGHTAAVELLLNMGVDVNAVDKNGLSSLHRTVDLDSHVKIAILELLLSHGANVDQKNNNESTTLYLATSCGHLDAVEVLLNHGASVVARNTHDSILHAAVHSRNIKVIEMILDKLQIELLLNEGLNAQDTEGDTPLMWAAEGGQLEAARALLNYGAKDDVKNNMGMSAFDWAIKNGHSDIAQLIETSQ